MEARAVAVKMINEDGGDQVVQRPELVDSDRAAFCFFINHHGE